MHVTIADIERLARNPSPTARADVAAKVAATLSAGAFTEKESTLAKDIIRILARDIEVQVRRAVALNLRDCLTVPHDVIVELARDVADVSVPLLRYSYALTEDDLIAVVKATQEVAKLEAVAGRESISQDLSGALLEKEIASVARVLFNNKGAVIHERQLEKHWPFLAQNASLFETLVHRGGLPVSIAEKLYLAVSDELRAQLARTYRLPVALVEEAIDDSREWAALGLHAPGGEARDYTDAELEAFIAQLYDGNRLTYSIIIRALCAGDLRFFEAAIARLAGISRINARILMFDSGPLGFKALYDKANMPEGFYAAIHALLTISLEETGFGRYRREDFRSRVLARIQSARLDRTVENMQYLLTIIGGKLAANELVH